MKKKNLIFLIFLASTILSIVAQPWHSTLDIHNSQEVFSAPSDAKSSFSVQFTIDLKQFLGEKTILDIPNILTVQLRQHDPNDRQRQNYPSYKMADGSVPVLESTITLHCSEHPDWKKMTIGIPLAILNKPLGKHELLLNFTGARWTMYVDEKLLDNDFPFGYPNWEASNTWKWDPEYVKKAMISFPAIRLEKQTTNKTISSPIQYWTPAGHNSWVGDVATLFYKGRYHLFYLYDRRHHGSKFGCGGHYFEHLSTTDFKTWTEHEAATPLEEQWETIGTGVPFVSQDKLCISYGLHTTRMYPEEKTTLPAQWEYLMKYGHTGEFNQNATSGFPAGSTYSVSTDGVADFKKSNIIFHPCENPSVYTDPEGKLRMMANYHSNGIWESDSIEGGWHCISPGFPPGGDCTFFFRWGRFDYIIGGFTGLWSKPVDAPATAYEDVVSKGLDFYDGSSVPSITGIQDGRFLMAGWIPIHGGWGGNLIIRELVQYPDGRIGSKWMKEILPEAEKSNLLAQKIVQTKILPTPAKSFMLTLEVHPSAVKKGRFAITFLPENGDQTSCELQIHLNNIRAQFAPGTLNDFSGTMKSLREGGSPHQVGNYAIENLIGVDKPFTFRVIVKGDDKLGGSLIDAEIAGQRTMISYRPGLTVKKLAFNSEGVEIRNVQVATLK